MSDSGFRLLYHEHRLNDTLYKTTPSIPLDGSVIAGYASSIDSKDSP